MRMILGPAACAALLAAGCIDSGTPTPTADAHGASISATATPKEQQVRVVGREHLGPTECGPERVARLVGEWFEAVNNGRPDVSSTFSSQMEWFTVTDRTRETRRRHIVIRGYDVSKLREYFQGRIDQHERLVLLEIEVKHDPARNLGHLAFTLQRRADDLPGPGRLAHGKGAVECGSGRIVVWSMSDEGGPRSAPDICPGNPTPPRIVLACGR